MGINFLSFHELCWYLGGALCSVPGLGVFSLVLFLSLTLVDFGFL